MLLGKNQSTSQKLCIPLESAVVSHLCRVSLAERCRSGFVPCGFQVSVHSLVSAVTSWRRLMSLRTAGPPSGCRPVHEVVAEPCASSFCLRVCCSSGCCTRVGSGDWVRRWSSRPDLQLIVLYFDRAVRHHQSSPIRKRGW